MIPLATVRLINTLENSMSSHWMVYLCSHYRVYYMYPSPFLLHLTKSNKDHNVIICFQSLKTKKNYLLLCLPRFITGDFDSVIFYFVFFFVLFSSIVLSSFSFALDFEKKRVENPTNCTCLWNLIVNCVWLMLMRKKKEIQ